MQASYTVRQEPDRSWSVLLVATGDPVRLAGIPQTGLTQLEAELTLDMLRPRNARPSQGPAVRSPEMAERVTASM